MSQQPRFAAGFFLAVTIAFFLPCLLTGKVFYPADFLFHTPPWYHGEAPLHNFDLFDVIIEFYPHDQLLNSSLKRGVLPQWNPYNFAGHPMLGDAWSGFLYPPRLLAHWALSTAAAHQALLFLHLALAGFGMWMLARRLGLSGGAAIVAGLAWMFNGVDMTWWEYEHYPICSALLPLLLISFDRARSSWKQVPLAAVMTGLLLVMGLMQAVAYALIILFFFMAWRLREQRWSGPALLRLGSALGLGFVLAAPNLLAIRDLLLQSQRPVISLDYLIETYRSFLWTMVPTIFAPDAFGTPVQGFAAVRVPEGGYFIYNELCLYDGVLPPLLALAALRLRGFPRYLWALLLIALLLPATPLYTVAFHLPGFSHLIATRIVYILVFFVALLAGYGWDSLRELPTPRLAVVALLLAVLWAGTVAAVQAHSDTLLQWMQANHRVRLPDRDLYLDDASYQQAVVQNFHDLYAWSSPAVFWPLGLLLLAAVALSRPRRGAAVAAIMIVDGLVFGLRYNTMVPPAWLYPTTDTTAFLTAHAGLDRVLSIGTFKPDTLMPLGVQDIAGYESIYPRRAGEYVGTLMLGPQLQRDHLPGQLFPIHNAASPLVNLAGVRYAVDYPTHTLPGWQLVAQTPLNIFENPHRLPRALVVPRHVTAPDSYAAVQMLAAREVDPSQAVVLEGDSSDPDGAAPGQAHIDHYDLQEVDLTADSPGPGWLLLTDTWTPDWKATVDGHPAPVRPADCLFRAVHLDAGHHQVVFRYDPDSWRLGWWLAAVAAAAIALIGWYSSRAP